MRKAGSKFYRARVGTSEGGAHLICVAYDLDSVSQFVGVEYYELVWSLPKRAISIPTERQMTFAEELRAFHHAASTFKGSRSADVGHIEEKLRETYGSGIVEFAVWEMDPIAEKADL